jgi:hypothetical protein
LREWSRLSYNVSEAETERAKAQLKASILLSLDGTTAVAEDIGRQIVTTGRRMTPDEVERVVGQISEKDVMDFARRKLWDQDIAISAIGSIEGLLDYNRVRASNSRNLGWSTARVERRLESIELIYEVVNILVYYYLFPVTPVALVKTGQDLEPIPNLAFLQAQS